MPFRMLRRLTALTLTGLIAGSALAGGEGWTEDFAGAKETAATEGKDLLLDFTGSDWCGWCIRLKDEVFTHDPFKQYAAENFVLVELDYPRSKPQTDAVKQQNAELKEVYKIRGYPTIFLADAQGRPYAQTGYQAGGPENYVEHLESLRRVRVERDAHLDAASDATGVAKAEHLHHAMQAVGDDLALAHYEATIQQIMELDADNAAGLKQHYADLYTAQQQSAELQQIMRNARGDQDAAMAQLDTFIAQDGLLASVKQEALAMKSQLHYMKQDMEAAKSTLQAAIDADPESEMAAMLRDAMQRIFADQP